uniref:Headcase N-terminal domain-containing protein n=1 Tax=Panagrolaimus superbus TaxID=310955 RepID=A0A914Y3U8_9BILA
MRHQQKNKEIAHAKKQMKEGNGGGKNKEDDEGIIRAKDGSILCCIPFLPCARVGHPLPESLADGVKLSCTNPDCLFSQHLVHIECFRGLETNLMKLLTSQGYRYCRKEGILLTKEMLWEPKGLSLLQKNLRCACGKGKMKRDDEAWVERQTLVEPPTEEKEKKKHKPAVTKPALALSVKKNAAPLPNFHQLNSHYLSSHSPTRSAAYVEDKYGSPQAITKMRRTSSNSIPSNDVPILNPLVVNHSPVMKKPSVPIGYAPIESSFPKLVEEKSPTEIKQQPDLVPHIVEQKSLPTAPEPTRQWQKVVNHTVKSKPVECHAELKNHTVQSETVNHAVQLKATEVVEKDVYATSPLLQPQFNLSDSIPKPKILKSIEVQTIETSFDQTVFKERFQKIPSSNNFYYDASTTPLSLPGSTNEYISDRKSRNTTSSGFASVSDDGFSPYQINSPVNEEVSSPAIVTFLFKDDETCAVEIYQNGRKEKLKNNFDNEWTSLYFSMAESICQLGETAQIHHATSSGHVVYDILKIIGKPINEIQIDPKWKFQLIYSNGIKCFEIETQQNGRRSFPEDSVLAAFFKEMKLRVKNSLKVEISNIYLSLNFDLTESQKNVFKNAALKVGLNILKFYVIDIQ